MNFMRGPGNLVKTESIDVMDALGSAIRIDSRGREVVRILPRVNEAINEEWISDKTRHVVDGLKTQRLDRPYLRVDGKLRPATWPQAFAAIAAKVEAASPDRIGAIAGDLASVEEMFALKGLMAKLGSSNVDCRQDGSKLAPEIRPRVLSLQFDDRRHRPGRRDYDHRLESAPRGAGAQRAHSQALAQGRLPDRRHRRRADLTYLQLSRRGAGIACAESPTIIRPARPIRCSSSAPARWRGPTATAVLASLAKAALSLGVVKDGWNGFNVLHSAASRVGGLDLGLVPGEGGLDAPAMAKADAVDLLFNLGADEIDIEPGAFVVYIGTHGDRGAHRADVVLPGAAYTEKIGHLRQYRGAAAIRRARGVSARRRARGLGDPARAV